MRLKQLAYGGLSWIPDPLYLRFRYRQRLGFSPNLRDPQRFTEKLQWLKLHDRQTVMPEMTDKIKFKSVVEKSIGADYVIPLLACGDRPGDLDKSHLPTIPFVLKTNHDSGGSLIVSEPKRFNIISAKKWLSARLGRSFYLANREWEYKAIKPRWLIEPLLSDSSGNSRLNDYKVHCFNGEPKLIQTIFDRDEYVKENWFDVNWNPQDFWYFSNARKHIERPSALTLILSLARKVAEPFVYARVDFYLIDGHPYLGEITFRPYGGFMKWRPDSADYLLGNYLDLTKSARQ